MSGKIEIVIKWGRLLGTLTKIEISLFSVLSTFVGFVLARQGLSAGMILPIVSVFFLASGACALNQYQERKTDRLMKRTEKRPIPSGQLSPSAALKIALVLLFAGVLILFSASNRPACALGLFAVVWYNGVYTPLKKRTAFAAVPGALIGAIPPAIGWFSGGGEADSRILAISLFFFIWQVPHFWILLLKFRKDYEKSELPAPVRLFSSAQFSRIVFMWVFATAVACVMLPLFGIVESHWIAGGLFITGAWLIWKGGRSLISRQPPGFFQSPFLTINRYVLLVMVLLTLDPFFR